MIIEVTSTQHKYHDGTRPRYIWNSKEHKPKEWEKIVEMLERNAKAGLLKMEVLQK